MAELVTVEKKFSTIRDVLAKRQGDIALAIPRGIDAQRFTRVALSNFQINPALLECTPASAFTAIMQAAAWGLELDPMLGQAYLVPYRDKRSGTVLCTLQLGYRGILALARRSNDIARFLPGVVHARDDFRYQRAGRRPDGSLGTILEHTEYDGPDDPGPVVATYIVCFFKSGEEQIDVMYRRDIDARRSRSRAGQSGPWVTDFDAMALKSVVKQAGKFWPLETTVAAAINQDELVDLGIDTPIMPALTENAGPDGGAIEAKPAPRTLEALIPTEEGTQQAKSEKWAGELLAERRTAEHALVAVKEADDRALTARLKAQAAAIFSDAPPLVDTIALAEYEKRVAALQAQAAVIMHDAKPPDHGAALPTDAELDAEIVRKEAAAAAPAATGQSGATAEEQARGRAKREQATRHEPPRAHRAAPAPVTSRSIAAPAPDAHLFEEREPGQEG